MPPFMGQLRDYGKTFSRIYEYRTQRVLFAREGGELHF